MTEQQTSPLTESLDSDVDRVHVTPGFGNRLKVRVIRGAYSREVPGTVAAVTIHGDGRIEYHPDPLEPK